MPISSCVIWPIFSFSVIWLTSFSTAAAEALAGGPAGVIFRCKNTWLSTMPEATSSAPEGAAKTVQTASKITICQSFLCGVVKGVSLPSILPPEAGYSKLWLLEISNGSLVNSGGLANCREMLMRKICCGEMQRLSLGKNIGSASSAAYGESVSVCCTPVDSPDVPHR